VFRAASPLRTIVPTCYDLVYCANCFPNNRTCTANYDNMHLVYMAGGYLSDTSDDALPTKGGRRMGFSQYKRQM